MGGGGGHGHHHHGGGGGRRGGGWWGGGGWGWGPGYTDAIVLAYPFPVEVMTTDEMGLLPSPVVTESETFQDMYGALEGLSAAPVSVPEVSNTPMWMSLLGAGIGASFGCRSNHPIFGAAAGFIAGQLIARWFDPAK